jgi:hypothetical protein
MAKVLSFPESTDALDYAESLDDILDRAGRDYETMIELDGMTEDEAFYHSLVEARMEEAA